VPKVKKFSTGPLGNQYPDHSERGNPNTRGLSVDGIPGVEAYIEEDRVLASEDNRPIKNLSQNDLVLEQNLAAVASEVDYGVLRGRDNELTIEVLDRGLYANPENPTESMSVTPLRIHSGYAIVDGQVVSIGGQKISYFIKDDGSYLFPDYQANAGNTVIPVQDDLYTGAYIPVYDFESEGLPDNFESYEIKIINKYDTADDRVIYFKAYRDWEDIVPYAPNTQTESTNLNFIYDENYGRESEGVWLQGGAIDNLKISDVVVKKNIQVRDKVLEDFREVNGAFEKQIITDGIFFDNINWKTDIEINKNIQDIYVEDSGDIYFVHEHTGVGENLLYLPNGSTQVTSIPLSNQADQGVNRIIFAHDLLFILGTNGYFRTLDTSSPNPSATAYDFFPISQSDPDFKDENFTNVINWQGKIWITTDKNIYYTDASTFAVDSTFDVLSFAAEIDTKASSTDVVESIKTLEVLQGNFFVDSSLKTDVVNLIKNPSFEKGGVGTVPSSWASPAAEISSSSSVYGSYSVYLPSTTISQTVYTKLSGDYTLSLYAKSASSSQITVTIEEIDSEGFVSNTHTEPISTTPSWERNDFSYTSIGESQARITIESQGDAFIDAVQFQSGELTQFVEGFEYLFVGFVKNANDRHNPPFAIIDSKRLTQINYSVGLYGEIKRVNDTVSTGNNSLHFIDDYNVYSLTSLNDEDEYNRFSITNITETNPELNLSGKVDRLETIESFDGRLLFGGSILNRAVSFTLNNYDEDYVVELVDINESEYAEERDENIPQYYNVADLLGDYRIIPAHDDVGISIEFDRVEDVYETRDGVNGSEGFYVPSAWYSLGVKIDDSVTFIHIQMPALHGGPVSIESIYTMLSQAYPSAELFNFDLNYSRSRVDGLYSIGKNKLTQHLRGDVKRIVKKSNVDSTEHYEKGFYVILEGSILKSKYDTNIKKLDNGTYIEKPSANLVGEVEVYDDLPQTAGFNEVYHVKDFGYYRWNGSGWVNNNYIYHWDLSPQNHSLREYKSKYNQSITFDDNSLNKSWLPIPVSPGYSLVPGSLRVKTNTQSEIGFSEGEDYFVDYDNGWIIRSTLKNYLQDSKFELVESQSSPWKTYKSNETFLQKFVDAYEIDGQNKIVESFGSSYVESNVEADGVVYQISKPESLNIGDTYTFSVYLKANKEKSGFVAISELASNTEQFESAALDTTQVQFEISDNSDPFNEWKKYTVSHTITNTSSQFIRVEISERVVDVYSKTFMRDAQLERNQQATPFVQDAVVSRIDAGLTLFVDFTETRSLTAGSDYEFDVNARKVVYNGTIDDDTELYFDYEYEKIFNPYVFGTSIPRFDVNYDQRDDYFLYLYSGRVWAINSVLSVLSQDEENPLIIDYNYHYPRIDKIKIRSNPDAYGNYTYIVKGDYDELNPYGPYDRGTERLSHVNAVTSRDDIEDIDSNDMIYEINVFDYDYNNNDIYDRRIYVDSKDNRYYNISLYDQTVGYFPFKKDFSSSAGIGPLNRLTNSKIVDIIKNFDIKQLEEIGAWGPNYQLSLRKGLQFPGTDLAIYVNVDNGSDSNDGQLFSPLKTIGEAVERIRAGAEPFIVVTSESLIRENVEFDLEISEIQIFAQTYARWSGAIQNKMPVKLWGFQFEKHNTYVVDDIDFYYCTFINSTVNNYFPTAVNFYNCDIKDGNNTFLYVKNTIFPSPFVHPYQRNVSANDGVDGVPESVATSDPESIHPDVGSYNDIISGNPSGSYNFERCLIHDMKDAIVKYELEDDEPWISDFNFIRSTIVSNDNLFYTNKSSQVINYEECIVWDNGEIRGSDKKQFDSESNINFVNAYIDFSPFADSGEINYNANGLIFGRETCVNGLEVTPGFISTQDGFENYRLRSEAQGYLTDSVCIGRAADGRDLGCYDELRERLDIEVPKNLKSYFAFVNEGIHYPIILNSEKITFSLEFKPTNAFTQPSVLFDTRSRATDKDWVVVVYNNNMGDDSVNIDQNPLNPITNPYTFKIIVANEETRYAVVSPVEMYSDADYQVWNKLSFTVNYEKTYNEKANFDEKDKYQNIITMFHNGELAVESFLKNDLSYDEHNEILDGFNNDNTNDWNYNDISDFITLASTFDQQHVLTGYYSELRIDNRFINRKELEAWNRKIVSFNDPVRYIDQNNLVRTFNPEVVNDLWTLKTKYDIGARGHRFNKHTHKRFTFDEGEFTWVLAQGTENLLENADLANTFFASVTTDVPPGNDSEDLFPVVFDHTMTITASGTGDFDSTTGVVIDFTDSGTQFYSHDEIYAFIRNQLDAPEYSLSNIDVIKLDDNRFRIIVQNYQATQVRVRFDNAGDAEEFGFKTQSGTGDGYTVDNTPSPARIIVGQRNDDSFEITSGITDDFKGIHEAWLSFSPEQSRFGGVSLGLSRVVTLANNDSVTEFDEPNKFIKVLTKRRDTLGVGKTYTYSVYLYRKTSDFYLEDIGCIVQDSEETVYNFDKIENIYGYWWLAQKTVTVDEADTEFGVAILGEYEIFIDAVQLEEADFASPFVLHADTKDGMIDLDKAILSENRGVIFFRFKPLFSYETSEKKVLLEALAGKQNEENDQEVEIIADEGKGFKVWYEYDAENDRGFVQFRSASIEPGIDPENEALDEAAWSVVAPKQFWDRWHTIVLSYDFDTKRFIYFFDYFKVAVDASIDQYNFFTNLAIGRSAILSESVDGEPQFAFGSRSADIMIKDLLITNYTTSDSELTNWINSNEFYKETIFNNLLDSYQAEMYDAISQIEGLSVDTFSLEQSVNSLLSRVATLESSVNSDVDITLLKVRQDELRNEIYHETIGVLEKIRIIDETLVNNEGRITQNRNDNIDQDVRIQENLDAISQEITDRIDAINQLINRLSSNTLGDGASMIGVHDPDNKFAATTVEGVLIESESRIAQNESDISAINTNISNVESTIDAMQDGNTGSWTDTKAINDGWNIASLRSDVDSNDLDITTLNTRVDTEISDRQTADATLQSNIDNLAGTGRTVETVKDNNDLITANTGLINGLQVSLDATNDEINLVKDGADGSTWNSAINVVANKALIDANTSSISTNAGNIQSNTDDITALEGNVTTLTDSLNQEILDRQAADTAITTNLASSSGASLVGIQDAADSFTSTNVEGALQEVDAKLQALAGALNWQASVNTPADLPTSGNNLNDSRIVENDGDGKRAQYVWDGAQWIKVSDVDWGDASGVVYDNSLSGLISTDVKSALDELYERSVAPNSVEETVASAAYTPDADLYYYDIVHDLETKNIAVRATNAAGEELGVESIERLDKNTVRVHIAQPEDIVFTVFGANNSYSKVIGSWTLSSGMYVKDVVHDFDTQNIMVSAFDITTGERVGLENIQTIDNNAIRVMSSSNSSVLNVFILKQTSNATTKDIEYWVPVSGMYESALPLAVDYDAVYSFYDPATSKTVEVDSVKFENGLLKIRRTENTPLRMVILK
jgi:hypothetical protein